MMHAWFGGSARFLRFRMSRLAASSLIFLAIVGVAVACPFCGVVQPTLAQRRDDSVLVALAEVEDLRDKGGGPRFTFHKIFKAPPGFGDHKALKLPLGFPGAKDRGSLKAGKLVLLFADGDPKAPPSDWEWTSEPADETRAGYFARLPDVQKPSAERLAFFVKYLEHADAWIAEDAFSEFGHAPYDEVLQVADRFDMSKVRQWFTDPSGRERRQGFYALVLGMAKQDADRRRNLGLLKERMAGERSDFRAGFDGVLAGYLLLTGNEGLERIVSRYIADKDAAHGDTRHALQALRFYHDYGPKELNAGIATAVSQLIDRPAFAAAAITDLARWQHWAIVGRVAPLYFHKDFNDGPTQRAIVGYLLACPKEEAKQALEHLRATEPETMAEIEKQLGQRTKD
jgi:hypothetical protein